MIAHCPDPKLITEPKTFQNQGISILFGLKNACHFPRQPTVPLSPTSEIFPHGWWCKIMKSYIQLFGIFEKFRLWQAYRLDTEGRYPRRFDLLSLL
jgi:hypothetical protein